MTAFEEIQQIVELFSNFKEPWFIVGGWGIDLFLNRKSRTHSDIEIAIYRDSQQEIQIFLLDWELTVLPKGTKSFIQWQEGIFIGPPNHQIRCHHAQNMFTFDILLNERKDDMWVYRRNARIQRSRKLVEITSNSGIPFFSPEIILLYKAKYLHKKDQADFDNVVSLFDKEQNDWLVKALQENYPDCPWIERILGAHTHRLT